MASKAAHGAGDERKRLSFQVTPVPGMLSAAPESMRDPPSGVTRSSVIQPHSNR